MKYIPIQVLWTAYNACVSSYVFDSALTYWANIWQVNNKLG